MLRFGQFLIRFGIISLVGLSVVGMAVLGGLAITSQIGLEIIPTSITFDVRSGDGSRINSLLTSSPDILTSTASPPVLGGSTAVQSVTASQTITNTATGSPTNSPTNTTTNLASTDLPDFTATGLPLNTHSPTFTPTKTPPPAPTYTSSSTAPPSDTPQPSNTSTPGPTSINTFTPTMTLMPTNTIPAIATNTPVPSTNTPVGPAPTATIDISGCSYSAHSTLENELLALINQARVENGLPTLRMYSSLRDAAREHSADMACNAFVSHTGSNGTTSYQRIVGHGYYPSWWGENIYKGWDTTPQFAFDWFMNSIPHRNNILNPNFIHIGIGHAVVSLQSQNAFTLNFGHP